MNWTIEQIMHEFQHNPIWGMDNQKTPDSEKLEVFKHTYRLPPDYVKMLSFSDGFVLLHGGDYLISAIDWVLECKHNKQYNAGYRDEILRVGCFLESDLIINQKEAGTDSYLYAGYANGIGDYVRVGTMTDFLNGFLEAKGNVPFWEMKNAKKYNFLAG